MEKPKFWHTPVGKILSVFVHDEGNATSLIGANILLIERELTKESPDKAEIQEDLEVIRRALRRLKDASDYMYKELKKLEGY